MSTWAASCGTKIPYPNRHAARRALAEFVPRSDRGMGIMMAYRCLWCGKWHLGHRGRGSRHKPARPSRIRWDESLEPSHWIPEKESQCV